MATHWQSVTLLFFCMSFVATSLPARAATWTLDLSSLDGTYQSWSATTGGPIEHVFEIPVTVPSDVSAIRGGTLGATMLRTDGIVQCCWGDEPCPRGPETPWVTFTVQRPESCGGVLYAENLFLIDDEPVGDLWLGPFHSFGETTCGEGFDYLREQPTLMLRMNVGANPFILICGWYEPASIDLSGLTIVFDVDRAVSGDTTRWGAVKALFGQD